MRASVSIKVIPESSVTLRTQQRSFGELPGGRKSLKSENWEDGSDWAAWRRLHLKQPIPNSITTHVHSCYQPWQPQQGGMVGQKKKKWEGGEKELYLWLPEQQSTSGFECVEQWDWNSEWGLSHQHLQLFIAGKCHKSWENRGRRQVWFARKIRFKGGCVSPAGQCRHAASSVAHRRTQRVKDSARHSAVSEQSLTESSFGFLHRRDVMLLDKSASSYQEKSSAIASYYWIEL